MICSRVRAHIERMKAMEAKDVRNLKKVDKVEKTTAAERLKKLNPKAELPPPGGEGSTTEDGLKEAKAAKEALAGQVEASRKTYTTTCKACGAPATAEGECSLAIPLATPGRSSMLHGEDGEGLPFEGTQCDDLAEFTRRFR